MAARKTGQVKWFNVKKGFGFITPADGSEDIFVHQTEIRSQGFRSLAEAEPVEYDTMIDENGRAKASNVTGPSGADVRGAPRQQYGDERQGGQGQGQFGAPRYGDDQRGGPRGGGRGGFGGGNGYGAQGAGGFRRDQ